MPIMTEANKNQVRAYFERLQRPVKAILVAEPGGGNPYVDATRELMSELTELTDKLSFEEYAAGTPEAGRYALDRLPALLLLDPEGRDRGVRFYGAPLGREFMPLLEDIADLSNGTDDLSAQGRAAIKAIAQDVVLEVFTTPT